MHKVLAISMNCPACGEITPVTTVDGLCCVHCSAHVEIPEDMVDGIREILVNPQRFIKPEAGGTSSSTSTGCLVYLCILASAAFGAVMMI